LSQVAELTEAVPIYAYSVSSYLQQNKAYATILDGTLGLNHRVTVLFRGTFLPQLERAIHAFESSLVTQQWSMGALIPLFLCHMQLMMCDYFSDAVLSGTDAELPPIMELVQIIKRWQFLILLGLPELYYDGNTVPPLLTNSGGGGNPSGSVPSANNQSGGSSLENNPNKRITNDQPCEHLTKRFQQHGQRLRTLTENNDDNIPKSKNPRVPGPLCLSFHLTSACFNNCKRKLTHHKLLTSKEEAIDAFMTACNVAPLQE